MAVIHIDLALEEGVAKLLQERAASRHIPPERYVADLISRDARRDQDELAEEGYRLLSLDTGEFAEVALQAAQDTWPEWNEGIDDDGQAKPR